MLTYISIRYTLNFSFFFFNDTATTEIYTLSLHDALPISRTEHLRRRWHDGRSQNVGTFPRPGISLRRGAILQSARLCSEPGRPANAASAQNHYSTHGRYHRPGQSEIGRASCRERG